MSRTLQLAALLLLTLSACVAVGPEPAPPLTQALSQQSRLEGSGIIGPVMVSAFPVTYPVKWSGSGTLTIQYPATPHVIVDGELVVEPIVPYEAETREAFARGVMAFRRQGVPAGISPPGTIGGE